MTEVLHASCVAVGERGLLILGPSGAGKSSLALTLMALGADLVSDDRTEVRRAGDDLLASPPATLAGLVEARGIGILTAPHKPQTRLTLAVDLGRPEPERLPPPRHIDVLGCALPLVLGAGRDHLPAAILCYLRGSRHG